MMESRLVLEGRQGWGVRRVAWAPCPHLRCSPAGTGRGSRQEAVSQPLQCRSRWEEQEQAFSDLMLFDC